MIKIQKFFTDCGVMSRRAAEKEIELGRVKVNGETATLGMRIDPESDVVEHNGKRVLPTATECVYIMLNKPRGYVTTMSDEKGRKTVADLTSDVGTRVYPVGRLDMDSDGLLLLTSDGELANKLTHPRHEIPKIYEVTVEGRVTVAQKTRLGKPFMLDGYETLPVMTEIVSENEKSTVLKMTLYEGRNRQIRRMCEEVGLKITRLCRVAIGDIKLGKLALGKWRALSESEIDYLRGN